MPVKKCTKCNQKNKFSEAKINKYLKENKPLLCSRCVDLSYKKKRNIKLRIERNSPISFSEYYKFKTGKQI